MRYEGQIRYAGHLLSVGEISEAEFQYACEVCIYGMSWKQHQLREAAIERLLVDGEAEDRAYAIDILNERGWFPKEDYPYVMPRKEQG
jgi:hypothetical protein